MSFIILKHKRVWLRRKRQAVPPYDMSCTFFCICSGFGLSILQEMRVKLKRRRERRMSRCLTKFHISGLGEPNIYHNLDHFTRMCDFTWKDSVRLESLVCPIFCYPKYHHSRVVIIFPQSIFNDLKSIPLV